jgi:hypothetical protein
MDLNLTVKKWSSTCHFNESQLREIASSMRVSLPDKMRLVYYGQKPPLDVSLSWQPTNGIEDPVGKVKNYTDGNWNE